MSKKMEKGSENGIFLDGREYTASNLYKLIALLVGNGVYANELAPTATNEDMSITHGTGHAWINGVAYTNSTPFVLEIATADGSLNRYDSLMLRLNLSLNEVYAVIVQGAYAANPTPPACTRNAETFDLKICDIYVPAGCMKITQDQITDTRLDSSVCGVPVFPVEHLDTTSFYRQIATDLANFQKKNEADFTAWVEDQKDTNLAAMAALVEAVRNTSDESRGKILDLLKQLEDLVESDTVGKLIEEINDKLSMSGGTMTGGINMNGNPISGLDAPTDDTQAVNKAYADLAAYPVGSIYLSVNATSPAELFGGTWEQLKERFLLGAGDGDTTYPAGSTGGESEHTLTQNEMPKHFHSGYLLGMGGTDKTPPYYTALNQSAYTYEYELGVSDVLEAAIVGPKGGGTSHNNMPPYLAVYMWKRVA